MYNGSRLICEGVKNPNRLSHLKLQQKLSYRKQIARQLHTQYVESIYDNPMTLKSRLTRVKIGGGVVGVGPPLENR